MSQESVYRPPLRLPAVFNLAAVILLTLLGAFGLWQATRVQVGPRLPAYLLLIVLAAALAPVFAYRVYSLYRSGYSLSRDGVVLQWGLRTEQIPMDKVLWAHPVTELEGSLPLPRLRWPGAVIGTRKLPDGSIVEFMAARASGLVLIALPGRYFAVSPANPAAFLETFERFMELGSLSPLPAQSVYPTFLLARLWENRPARWLVLGGLVLSFLLLAWTTLVISSVPEAPLRLSAAGAPLEMAPSVRLLLLPVLNGLIFFIDFLAGLFFFRYPEGKTLAFLSWGAGVLTPVLFLIGLFFLQRAA